MGGLLVEERQSNRFPHLEDYREFHELIGELYRVLNWFSLKKMYSFETGGCCNEQSDMYKNFGQKNGLSPRAYLMHAMNFYSDSSRKLNFIEVEYDSELCLNIVLMVGFGSGDMTVTGDYFNTDFILPQQG